MAEDFFAPGAWNAICQRCGAKRKSYNLRQEWNGLRVCVEHFESRHPQDFVRGRRDRQAPPWTSSEPDAVFLSTNEVSRDDL